MMARSIKIWKTNKALCASLVKTLVGKVLFGLKLCFHGICYYIESITVKTYLF